MIFYCTFNSLRVVNCCSRKVLNITIAKLNTKQLLTLDNNLTNKNWDIKIIYKRILNALRNISINNKHSRTSY